MAYTDIDKPSDYFNTVLYTGDGTSSRSITGVGFQPDWVWFKKRSTTGSHNLADSVRGTTKVLLSNQTLAEITDATTLTSFDSDGFSIGTGWNASSTTMVTWNWLASNTTASNTDGSITSTVSANTTSGFSIVSYTGNATYGATVGHGLGSAPKMIIVKNRTDAVSWYVFHESIGNGKALSLNLTNAEDTSLDYWNNTSPTSSVFSLGNFNAVNGSSDNMIAYCFAEKKGFSKFGSYTGNGSADGTFVYLGFKPAFFILKAASGGTASTRSWRMLDNTRDTFNVTDTTLYPNENIAEDTGGATSGMDFVSNGIKIRGTSAAINESGTTFIYMAIAENPLVSTAGVPCTAR